MSGLRPDVSLAAGPAAFFTVAELTTAPSRSALPHVTIGLAKVIGTRSLGLAAFNVVRSSRRG